MRGYILFLSILHIDKCYSLAEQQKAHGNNILHCACPPGFDLASDVQCWGEYASMTLVYSEATNTAVDKCAEIKGIPVSIHNDEQQSYWTDLATQISKLIPLGLTCDTHSKLWKWADGSELDFKPSSGVHLPDLNKACKSGCSWYLTPFIDNGAQWWMYCNYEETNEFDIFCTTQLRQPVTSADGCANFEDDNEDAVCYQVETRQQPEQVGVAAQSWQDAQIVCRELGANLASIHNSQENSFLRRLAVSKGAVNGVFLGATTTGKDNDFGWVDGSAWDYANFRAGFPIPGVGDCLVMDTSTSTGLWMNNACSEQLPVACIRQPINRTVSDRVCSDGPWEEGTIITSPGFPYDSSMPCEYFLAVDVGKKVEVEILLLEANSCCDYVTFNDGFIGGHIIANLTGAISNVTYTTSLENSMRVSWQPNGGVNVKGFAMTFRGV